MYETVFRVHSHTIPIFKKNFLFKVLSNFGFRELKKRVPKGQVKGGGSLVWQLKTVYVMNMLHIWYLRVPLRMENMLNTYFDVIQPIENFLELHEVQKVIKNQLFSSFWASKSPFSLASNQKKSHVGTFSCIKTVWSIVWQRRLLLRVPMDLNMC